MALASFRLPSVCTMNVLRAGPLVHRGDEQELLYLYATPREFIRCPAADQCDESRVRDREEAVHSFCLYHSILSRGRADAEII